MASVIEEIKEKLDIAEVIGSYIKLEKAGKNFKARCPFHGEKTPSFFVSPQKNSFYCFGCNVGGDIFSFVEKMESVDFKSALRLLADRAGVKLVGRQSKEDKSADEYADRLYACLEEASARFEKELSKHEAPDKYLKERGLSAEMIKRWRIGFAPEGWRNLKEYLLGRGFSEKEMKDAGLTKQKEEGRGESYDVFRNRIIFPIFDSIGRVVAFSGRTMSADKDEAKYLNSPETPVFKKAETLYGFHVAKFGMRKMDFAMIVEGQMDLLMSHQSGFTNAVASSGTALTAEHLKKIRRITGNLVMAFDSDGAGIKAAKRALEMAMAMDFNVKIANLAAKDPADLAKEDPALLRRAIKESEEAVSFFWNKLNIGGERGDKAHKIFRSEIIPLLAGINNSAERSRLISKHKMSLVLGIREDFLWEEIKRAESALKRNGDEISDVGENQNTAENVRSRPADVALARLAGFLKKQEAEDAGLAATLKKKIDEIAGAEEFEKRSAEAGDLLQRAEMEEVMAEGSKEFDADRARELLRSFEIEWLKEKLAGYLNELDSAEKSRDKGRVDEILKKCQNASSRINQLIKEKDI